ncbi:MAG TPA: chromate resistance protein ChrB domain-containing protein [Streptosporangiaceae bacterium]
MKWITRENANVDRIACPWLIRRFIDADAEFLFVAREHVLAAAAREGGHSYDAPGAEYTHRDGKCSFDVLVEEFNLTGDPALVRLAEIVHAADVSEDRDSSAEGPGLYAIAHGFALLHGTNDQAKIDLETPMYDALYAWCQDQVSARA